MQKILNLLFKSMMPGPPPGDRMVVVHMGGPGGPPGPERNGRGPGRAGRDARNEGFRMSQVVGAFSSLPRVMRLVWTTSASLTFAMGFITIIRGFIPAISAFITKLVIDSVVNAIPPRTGSAGTVFWLVLLQLLIQVGSSLMMTVSNIVQQLLQDRVAMRVQLMVMEKANTLDLSFFENPEFYDKLRQAQEQVGNRPVSMVSTTFDLFRTIITFFSMIALLLQLEWWIAVVALVVPIPTFIADTRFGWQGYQRSRWQSPERRQMAYYNHVMTTDIYNKEIKLFTLGNFFIDKYRKLAVKLFNENKNLLISRYMTNFLLSSLGVIANSAIYLYVALQAVAGRITLGDLTLFTQAAMQVSQSFQSLLSGISSTYENNLFVSTLFEFLEYEPQIKSPGKPQPIETNNAVPGLSVEFRNVTFTYPGKDVPALQNVSFKIAPGEAVALVGRNGAGKTTLVKLITRLYDPDEGEIIINGRNVKDYDLRELREQVGVIFQDYVNYHMTASENIGVGRISEVDNQPRIEASAHKSGADAVIEKLPEGYDSMLGRWFNRGLQLSGGEWQKIALARAFMRDARILILDEPTSSLDAQAEYDVFAQFRVLTAGKTAIFISHRFSTVRLADRILVIENGVLIENGSHSELMALDGRYAHLFNLQAEAYR